MLAAGPIGFTGRNCCGDRSGFLRSPRTNPRWPYLPLPDEATAAVAGAAVVGETGLAIVFCSGLGTGDAELRSAPAFGAASPSDLTIRGVTKNRISSACRDTVRRLNNSPSSGTRETPGVRFWVLD